MIINKYLKPIDWLRMDMESYGHVFIRRNNYPGLILVTEEQRDPAFMTGKKFAVCPEGLLQSMLRQSYPFGCERDDN